MTPAGAADLSPRAWWARRMTQLTWALLAVSLCYILYLHQAVIQIAAPLEYREGAIVITTDLMLHGGNPYAVSNQPVYTNVYGVGYNLTVLPFAKLFGNGFIVHRAISVAYVLAACGLMFQTLRHLRVPGGWAFAGTVLFYADIGARCAPMSPYASPLSIIARPDSLGLLLFLGSVLIPLQRRFSHGSIAAAGVMAVAAFFTKPYFVIGYPVLLTYVFLFRSKLKAMLHGVGFTIVFVACLWLIVNRCETYWAITIKGNEFSVLKKWPHLFEQIAFYARSVPGTLIALCIAMGLGVRRLMKLRRRGPLLSLRLDAPLLRLPVDFVWFLLAGFTAVLVWKLGPHPGNSMIYFYQLFSPFMLLIVFRLFRRRPWQGSPLLVGLILLDAVLLLATGLPKVPASYEDQWEQWRSLLAGRQKVYVPPPLAYMAYEQGKTIYDNGMSPYYVYSLQEPKTRFDFRCREEFAKFRQELFDKADRQELELIVMPVGRLDSNSCDVPMPEFIGANHIAGYRVVGRAWFPMDWSPYFYGVVLAPAKDLPPGR